MIATRFKHNYRLITLLCLLLAFVSQAQTRKARRDITTNVDEEYSSLKDSFSTNKEIPAKFEKQILYALSYFPELRQARIKFVLRRDHGGIISSRPTIGGIFQRSSKRQYVVFIEDSSTSKSLNYHFRYADVNGQTGIVAHELSHIVYFSHHSGVGLLRLAAAHLSRKYMDRFEYNTDSATIVRGFGYQLIAWNVFLRKAFGVPNPETAPDPFINSAKRERYMSFTSIRRVMDKSPIYKEEHSSTN